MTMVTRKRKASEDAKQSDIAVKMTSYTCNKCTGQFASKIIETWAATRYCPKCYICDFCGNDSSKCKSEVGRCQDCDATICGDCTAAQYTTTSSGRCIKCLRNRFKARFGRLNDSDDCSCDDLIVALMNKDPWY
jgi:hypothetical protein